MKERRLSQNSNINEPLQIDLISEHSFANK
jgi:hypothetical protein